MSFPDDLLRQFRATGSEPAFRALVDRYVDLVYSVALRGMNGDAHAAEDVTQKVFVDLARLAAKFPDQMQLGGWLHRHTCFVAGTMRRGEQRRAAREREAVTMHLLQADSTDSHRHWAELTPVLDEAINQLDDDARDALVLRFFEQRDFKSVGAALGVSDDTAQKRVSRALDRLRTLLQERGIGTAAAALGVLLTQQAVTAAPAGLAANTSAQALAINTAATTATAGAFGLTLAALFKWGAAAAVATALVGTGIWVNQKPVQLEAKAPAAPAVARSVTPKVATSPSIALPPTLATKTATTLPGTDTNLLRLTFVAADSGAPVPNVLVEWRAREGATNYTKKQFTANRVGVCDVPVERERIQYHLELLSICDGFADTRLLWTITQGDVIPTNYTVKLDRPVRLGGRVLDPDDKPVVGGRVGFGYTTEPEGKDLGARKGFESHEFKTMGTETDAQGNWSINRIGADMVYRLTMSARHPDYAPSEYQSIAHSQQLEKELRDGTHIIHLNASLEIRGSVVTSEGRPIPNARVMAGGLSADARTNITRSDGSFAIKGRVAGQTLLTAEAEGYGITTTEVMATNTTQRHKLVLSPARPLRVRIVGSQGEPLPGARLLLNRPNAGFSQPGQTRPAGIEAMPLLQADEEGRITWLNAPDRELAFSVVARGHFRIFNYVVPSGGLEHTIALQRALTIKGTVKDAATGEPVPHFRIVAGYPQGRGNLAPVPRWSDIDRFAITFSDGRFQHTFEEPVVIGIPNPGYLLRFDAPDYASAVSRVIAASEGEVQLDVQLQRATSLEIAIFLPDGRPAAGAEVGLATESTLIMVKPGGAKISGAVDSNSYRKADGQGRLKLRTDPAVQRIVIAHAGGYAETTFAALENAPNVSLELWGRIEGTFRHGGQPKADAEFNLSRMDERASDPIGLDFASFRAVTDDQGRFAFPKVPPGSLHVRQVVPGTDPRMGNIKSFVLGVPASVRPGETATLDLSAASFHFTGTIQWPEGMQLKPGWNLTLGMELPTAQAPNPLPYYQNTQLLTSNSEGGWMADNIMSGPHQIVVRVTGSTAEKDPTQPRGYRGKFVWYAFGTKPVTIPDEVPAAPIDFGVIQLQANPEVPK